MEQYYKFQHLKYNLILITLTKLSYFYFPERKKEAVPCSLFFTDFSFFFCLQDDLLKILGEKHRLYEFLNTFSVKCSYLLFNKEHVKTILLETTAQKSAENAQHTQSCMNILVVRICHLALFFLHCYLTFNICL